MSTQAPPLPPQLPIVPAPQTVAEAIGQLHVAANRMMTAAERLLELADLREQTPEMHTVVINAGNNGQYQVLDRSAWTARSIGVLNPGAATVFIGVGGSSATAAALAPSCPGASALVLPVEAGDLNVGCDPVALGADTAVIWIFRYLTVQPLVLRQVP